ncbi:Asparagine synthetase [glutamine-hydrolyzing] 1 [Lacunisphaera limnophila]|uniref:asparagine synthase (glutamine-hydrolyzing) n=2 Tax=Lacunisphaera limnophila TaxID=1838286 RepID=A0A1D8AXY7_9BACT|nr:Asparagine synthetase [glutamine-hydrolyzing] 1 [Lacunisphaera limnophila]
MVQRMVQRGPDDQGLMSDGDVTLGMCRLAIFDPANGRQPTTTPDGRFTIVFNGAIYNHRELRTGLEAEGWTFRTHCDTEVLLAAYARYGADCLPRLRGMFAFAVWDTREHTLFAARDPLGIKPLYYARLRDTGLVFASELNALLAGGQIAREIDPAAVGEYLAWFSVPAPRTIYRGIANLPPGHSIVVDAAGTVLTRAWWHLPAPVQPARVAGNYQDFIHGLRHQLEDTIRAHRVADVPVGAFLSGGMDSTAVVGLMTRQGGPRLKTFSLIFGESGYSEQAGARLAAQTFGTEHHEDLLTGARIAADLPRILATFDQPTGDGINTWYASRLARAGGVTVALSGLGGDELFGGYPSFRDLPRLQALLPLWRRLPRRLRVTLVERLRALPGTRARKLADFLAHARDLHELASLQRRVLPETQRLSLLTPEARRLATRLGPNHPMLEDFAFELIGADPFQIISAWELRTYMADTLLRDSDVFSMAHSLELRVPFVDRALVDWLWPQPAWFKYDPRRAKRALADATADLVPAAIRNRPKQGFTLPFAHWMRAELKPFLDHTFSPGSLAACPWLEATEAQAIWRNYITGQDTRAWSRVWTLAMLIAFANRSAAS